MLETVSKTIEDFCIEFIKNPYLCYTEHGQHALFYTMLYNAIPETQRYINWEGKKVCVIQKEYPTAQHLDRSRRQNWDIAVLRSPSESTSNKTSYDYLKLLAVIEFGLNEAEEHLRDDIERLCHDKANLEHGFIVHLYRLSEAGNMFSSRDWSSDSARIVKPNDLLKYSANNKAIDIYYGRVDSTKKHEIGLWHIKDGQLNKINIEKQ